MLGSLKRVFLVEVSDALPSTSGAWRRLAGVSNGRGDEVHHLASALQQRDCDTNTVRVTELSHDWNR
jgi:hypothetical protein